MADDRDFLDRMNASSQNWAGVARAPEDVVREFHIYGHAKRAEALDQLDHAFHDVDPNDVRKVHELGQLRRNLRGINDRLIKAGR